MPDEYHWRLSNPEYDNFLHRIWYHKNKDRYREWNRIYKHWKYRRDELGIIEPKPKATFKPSFKPFQVDSNGEIWLKIT